MRMDAAFSPDCRYYAALSEDGRLKIWQTETNTLHQEYTPDLHLSAPPVCLTWIVLSTASPTKKAKKRKSIGSESDQESSCLALGTSFGKILIYSVAQAKVETILDPRSQDIKDNAVTSIDWHRDYGLYSSTGDSLVYEWDVNAASVKHRYNVGVDVRNKGDTVTAIKIVPQNLNKQSRYIVTASCQLRLWSLDPLTVLRTMVGHSGAVSALAMANFVGAESYVVSCTKTERLISFWDVTITSKDISNMSNGDKTPSKKHRRKSTSDIVVSPAYNFVMEDAPTSLDVAVRKDDGVSRVNLATVTRSGVVHYYGHVLNGSSSKPIKPSLTLHVSTEDVKPMPLQCCRLLQTERDGEMLVGYRITPGRLFYERVIPELKNKTQVLIRQAPTESKAFKARANSARDNDAPSNSVTYVEPVAASRKRMAPGKKVEVPMESRLANLALHTSRGGSAVNQNLTKLLVQGLHSGDTMLLQTVLQSTEPAVADRTVAALPPSSIPALLQQLAEQASKRTSQCKAVCVWLNALLRSHAALLLATLNTPDTGEKFSRLLAVLTQRRSHVCRLLNLKGRLELTIAQRTRNDKRDFEHEAVIDYIDTSSGEESDGLEMDVAAESDNTLDWDEDERDDDRSDDVKDDSD